MAYTAKLDIASINKIPRFMLIRGYGMGRGIHIVRASVRARIGAIINMVVEDARGCKGSLINSLTASAIGCKSPWGPTMLGPLRNCI